MKETEELAAANKEPSEDWVKHYEAINNLRVFNKFNFEAVGATEYRSWAVMNKFAVFIVREITNLRSNNSKNALTLMSELFLK
jgi:hypothetical protein